MKNRLFILFLIASLVLTLSACQAAGPASGGSEKPTEAPTEPSLLTADEAQAIALKAAGVTEYTHLRAKFEIDDGVQEYEVDFRSGDWEFEYTVHAVTGQILSSDKELDPKPKPTDPEVPKPTEKPTETPVKPTEAPKNEYISKENAENIALDHAGLDRAPVRFDRTEFDKDDGVPVYEIEFHVDGWEYDYEIHAVSGKVLSHSKEKESRPVGPVATEKPVEKPTEAPKAEYLSKEEAENIALNHAGLKRADVRFDRTEFDKDDGVPVYEIEFHVDGWEYSYEIHAESGKIRESEKDRDD